MGDARATIEAIFRIEWPKLVAGIARITRDVGTAEELAQDALAAALEEWPAAGVPEKPGAWLMATAKNRAIDVVRRGKVFARKQGEIGALAPDAVEANFDEAIDQRLRPPAYGGSVGEDVGEDLLRLVFVCCHPILSPEARVALTLRLLGGLETSEIARAFVAPEPTIAQRIVRAKKTLAEARVPFEVPRGEDRAARLASVLEVVYLIFNEGYSATAGDDWVRPALCEDALRLGRVLAELAPGEPEAHGLIALMEIQASRLGARVGPSGEPILLLDQNRARWDRVLIGRGLAALARAEAAGSAAGGTARAPNAIVGGARGPYALQAAIAACHARAATADATDWARIAALYEELARVTPSPVIELNRAVAVSMAEGPAAALAIVDAVAAHPAMRDYHLVPAVRGDLLAKLGRRDEARAELERAASLTRNERERALLLERARQA